MPLSVQYIAHYDISPSGKSAKEIHTQLARNNRLFCETKFKLNLPDYFPSFSAGDTRWQLPQPICQTLPVSNFGLNHRDGDKQKHGIYNEWRFSDDTR